MCREIGSSDAIMAVIKERHSNTAQGSNVDIASQNFATRNRVLYLRTLTEMAGKNAEFKMHGGVSISGVFKVIQPYNEKFFITDAVSAGGSVPAALLRSSDVIAARFDAGN